MADFPEFNRQKACRYGQMLYNVNDTFVGRSLDLYGEYCEAEIDVFRRVIRPGSIVVEVGANIGAQTLFLARQVTTSGVVVAFEPQRVLFQTLCANLALNSITNTFCFQQGVGAQPGSLVVPPIDYTKEMNFGCVALREYPQGERVPIVRLDDMNLPGCHFLKIDVEGMEQEVLQGALQVIEQFKPVMYVENDLPHKAEALARFIDSLSYKMYWHQPAYYNPGNFFGNAENVFAGYISRNMICIHQSVSQHLPGFEPVTLLPT